jgi:hypothetical protein
MIITRFLIGNLNAWLDWILRQMLLPQALVMEAGAVPVASGCLHLPPSNLLRLPVLLVGVCVFAPSVPSANAVGLNLSSGCSPLSAIHALLP